MSTFHLGNLSIDAVEYASQGNAILGIRDSGKTYTAMELAEKLMDEGIPMIAFDPIGVWRFLRVPGKGRGYPVVVAGGSEGDLPLTIDNAPEIVRAAMNSGVSLVIDLFDMNLSKADWRRIVLACVNVLLHENKGFGLRHVFIEEAAEFIPQKPIDGMVYAAIEKLARMGGNSRLGYTLINQRSQEVAKSVLELCENVFLHRQRGKNALENMDKWLEAAGATEKRKILQSLPDLPKGTCWAWLGGDKPQPPMMIQIPEKNSFHPDRRVLHGEAGAVATRAVDVSEFVARMKTTLTATEAVKDDNDVAALRRQVAQLRGDLARAQVAGTDQQALDAAHDLGYGAGVAATYGAVLLDLQSLQELIATMDGRVGSLIQLYGAAGMPEEGQALPAPPPGWSEPAKWSPATAAARGPRPPTLDLTPQPPAREPMKGAATDKVLRALAELASIGVAAPQRVMVAMMAGYSNITSKAVAQAFASLREDGSISIAGDGRISLTPDGKRVAPRIGKPATGAEMRDRICGLLGSPADKIIARLVKTYPKGIDRVELAAAVGYSNITSKAFAQAMAKMGDMGFLETAGPGKVKATDVLFPS